MSGAVGDRVEELEPVVVHQERDRRAVRATAEAVVELFGRRPRERRRALVVARAARGVFLALALERHAPVDHLDAVRPGQTVIADSIGYPPHPSRPPTAQPLPRPPQYY